MRMSQPHPRDIWANMEWFSGNGVNDPRVALDYANRRYETWRRERDHLIDKLILFAALVMMMAFIVTQKGWS